MPKETLSPVLLVIFNRPETSDKCFEAIRQARPKKLYIAADGPRKDRPDDVLRCKAAREIATKVDWPCELHTLFRDENLGCRAGTVGGIEWMLSHEPYGIIFDDDCVADPTFFAFCDELLEKYKDNEKVMHICGTNFQEKNSKFHTDESYYFSRISQNWGWATWKRAWVNYEPEMEHWPELKGTEKFKRWIKNALIRDYWTYVFDRRYRGELTDWDIPWTYSCMKNEGLCIAPALNLVTNIGSGAAGTHGAKSDRMAHVPTTKMAFPLIHPSLYKTDASHTENINEEADRYLYKIIYSIDTSPKRSVLLFLKTRFPSFYQKVKLLVK